MRNKILFIVSGVGLLLALVSAYIFSQQPQGAAAGVQPGGESVRQRHLRRRASSRAPRPRARTSISTRRSPDPITAGLVSRGPAVHKGDPLLTIDDSVQRATTEQLQAQAEAALALLQRAEGAAAPREPAVAAAQVDNAKATLKNAQRSAGQAGALLSTWIRSRSAAMRWTMPAMPRRSPPPTWRSSRSQYELTQGRRLELRHPEPGEASTSPCSKALCGGGGAARQVHDQGARRRHRARRAGRRSAAMSRRRAPTTPTPRASDPLHRHGRARGHPAGACLHRRDPDRPAGRIRRRSRRRCSSAAPTSTFP